MTTSTSSPTTLSRCAQPVNAEERARLVREVTMAGNCSHPIRLRGDMVNLATGEINESQLRVACKDRRQVVCPSCSYLYRTDAWIVVASGLVGGKRTPESIASHPRLFVTLTAPSFGPVHTITDRGFCVTHPAAETDTPGHSHSHVATCSIRHPEHDPQLGRPLCPECFDYEGLVLWNAHSSRLWRRTILHVRRLLAEEAGVSQSHIRHAIQVNYLKVAEIQRRGAVHFHTIIRADGPDSLEDAPPPWLTSAVLARTIQRAVRNASLDGLDGSTMRWGRVFDIQDLSLHSEEPTQVASYIAKYSTKTTDGTSDLARRFKLRRQIENLVENPHARQLALTAWDLGDRDQYAALMPRNHAHAFGFTGQLITKSHHYSTTFGALRTARAQHMAAENVGDPIAGTFQFEGRGYDDPRAVEVAEIFFTMQRQLRSEAAAARRLAHNDTSSEGTDINVDTSVADDEVRKASDFKDYELT